MTRFLAPAVAMTALTAMSLPAIAGDTWRVEADNGQIFEIDKASIKQQTWPDIEGNAWSRVEVNVRMMEGDRYIPKHLYFDCRGHFMDDDEIGRSWDAFHFAPSRSVVGRISQLVCATLPPVPSRASTPAPVDIRPTVDQWLSAGSYDLDVNSIKRSATSATATVRKDGKVATLIFDCRGHFQDAADVGRTQIAPPGSIASGVANTACATPNR
jgi:hypothetical protein